MIMFILAVVLMVILSGLSIVTGAEFDQQVKAFELWVKRLLARWFMPASGTHVVPAREVAESARRTPSGVETLTAAGGAPASSEAGAVPVMRQASEPPLPRPVNGRTLGDHGTLPRRQPGGTLPRAEPLVDRGPGMPPWETQEMPAVREPCAPEVTRPLGVADLGPADAKDRTLAERVNTR